jgi:sarcosine oxidase
LNRYDIIIAGLGATGSAAAFHLAQRGRSVLGFDRFGPPHAFGSSHGQTRIIREAYLEHPDYVPLIQRAYVLWEELESHIGQSLLRPTGGLMIGLPDSAVVSGAQRSAERHALAYEYLESSELHRRFPALQPADGMVAIWEPHSGILFPEACVAAHIRAARDRHADLRTDEPVQDWRAEADGIRVRTTKGEYHASQLLVCAGSWIKSLLPGVSMPFTVERQIQFWFQPKAEFENQFTPECCPIHIWEYEPGRFFYGFPDLGEGVKVARHHEGVQTTMDSINRTISPIEVDEMRWIVRRFLPGADGPLRSAVVCQYTNTPDGHFWIDRHPTCPQVLIASACSGHGFKFASVMGEVLADLLIDDRSAFDLRLFAGRSFH